MYFIFLFSLYKGAWTSLEYEFAQLCLNQLMVSTALDGIDSLSFLFVRLFIHRVSYFWMFDFTFFPSPFV